MEGDAVLRHIMLAREHARLNNYEAALNSYANAKEEVDFQINTITDREELKKWNLMARDIAAEKAIVVKLSRSQEAVVEALERPYSPPSKEEAPEVDVPIWSRPEPSSPKVVRRQEKRPVVQVRNQPKRVNSRQQPKGVQPKGVQGKGAPIRNARPSPPTKVSAAKQEPERPKLDPSTDPLAQQIIDMGILIREPNTQWDAIAGLAQVKRLLRQNLVILPMRPDICKGLLAPWKTVLFYGPPGTGKTFLAKAVATECKRTFFNVTSATITSRFHGESEKLVAHLFTLAEQMSPATIFFDEIDSIASQRGGGNEHEASRRMKAQLLTRLEGVDSASDTSNVFILAATNFPWDLDEALLRRFQKRIYIPLPDVEARIYLLKMHIGDMVSEDFDMELWAQKLEGYSCADITNLCRDAAQYVFDKQTALLDTQQFLNMPLEQARVVIGDEDFAKACGARKSSVDSRLLARYEEWRKQRGAE